MRPAELSDQNLITILAQLAKTNKGQLLYEFDTAAYRPVKSQLWRDESIDSLPRKPKVIQPRKVHRNASLSSGLRLIDEYSQCLSGDSDNDEIEEVEPTPAAEIVSHKDMAAFVAQFASQMKVREAPSSEVDPHWERIRRFQEEARVSQTKLYSDLQSRFSDEFIAAKTKLAVASSTLTAPAVGSPDVTRLAAETRTRQEATRTRIASLRARRDEREVALLEEARQTVVKNEERFKLLYTQLQETCAAVQRQLAAVPDLSTLPVTVKSSTQLFTKIATHSDKLLASWATADHHSDKLIGKVTGLLKDATSARNIVETELAKLPPPPPPPTAVTPPPAVVPEEAKTPSPPPFVPVPPVVPKVLVKPSPALIVQATATPAANNDEGHLYNQYIELIQTYERETASTLDTEVGKSLSKVVSLLVNTIGVDVETQKFTLLRSLLAGGRVSLAKQTVVCESDIQKKLAALLVARRFLGQASEQVSAQPSSTKPLAVVLSKLWPQIGPLFEAYCIQAVPALLPYSPLASGKALDSSDENSIAGIATLYSAALVEAGDIGKLYSWWVRTLKSAPHVDITALVLHRVLVSSCESLQTAYSKYFVKLSIMTHSKFLPSLNAITAPPITQRLNSFFETEMNALCSM